MEVLFKQLDETLEAPAYARPGLGKAAASEALRAARALGKLISVM